MIETVNKHDSYLYLTIDHIERILTDGIELAIATSNKASNRRPIRSTNSLIRPRRKIHMIDLVLIGNVQTTTFHVGDSFSCSPAARVSEKRILAGCVDRVKCVLRYDEESCWSTSETGDVRPVTDVLTRRTLRTSKICDDLSAILQNKRIFLHHLHSRCFCSHLCDSSSRGLSSYIENKARVRIEGSEEGQANNLLLRR